MLIGDGMIKNIRIVIFIFIAIMLMYIGVVGLVLINGVNDLVCLFLVSTVMFIFAGCIYKAVLESAGDTKKN